MTCEMLQSRLSAYLDGELAGRDMMAIRTHVHQCPECAQILEIERMTKEALAGIPSVEPPADFEERLIATVMAAPVRKSRNLQIGFAFAMTTALTCALTLGYLRASKPEASAPTVASTYESKLNEAYMAGWDPYGGGSPVVTPSR